MGSAPAAISAPRDRLPKARSPASSAVAYVVDQADAPQIDEAETEDVKARVWHPIEHFAKHRGATTREDLNPHYLLPKMGLLRLQKIMDEYVGGPGAYYMTNEPLLNRGLELLSGFKEDLGKLGARDLHDLLRCWELWDRTISAECHIQHVKFREETRWPGYYNADHPKLDDKNWKVFVNSRLDPATSQWEMSKKPYIPACD